MKFLFVALSLFTSMSLHAQSQEFSKAKAKAETRTQETVSAFKQTAILIPAILSEANVEILKTQDQSFRKARLSQAILEINDAIERSSKNDQNFFYETYSRLSLPRYLLDIPSCNPNAVLCELLTKLYSNSNTINELYLSQIRARLETLIDQATDKASKFAGRQTK